MSLKNELEPKPNRIKSFIYEVGDTVFANEWLLLSCTPLIISIVAQLAEQPIPKFAMNLTVIPTTHTIAGLIYRFIRDLENVSLTD